MKLRYAVPLVALSLAACGSVPTTSAQPAPSPSVVTVTVTVNPSVVTTTSSSPSATPTTSAPKVSPTPKPSLDITEGKLNLTVPRDLRSPGLSDRKAEYNLVGPRTGKPTGTGCNSNVNLNKHQYNWFAYEVAIRTPDADRNAPQVCEHETAVCNDLHAHHSITHAKNMIQEKFHYDPGSPSWNGTEALIKAATTVICPGVLSKPYQTAFDRTVNKYKSSVLEYIRLHGNAGALSTTDYGIFMKQVCDVITHEPDSLPDRLVGGGDMANMYISQTVAHSTGARKWFVNRAVFVGCNDKFDSLDSYWTTN
jgi:hypothetical protein